MKHGHGNVRLSFVSTLAVITLSGIVLAMASGSSSLNSPAPQPEQTRSSIWPTYHKEVKPIIEKHCAGCHVDGGIAPFALTDEKDVTARASEIADAVKSRRMPPWMAGADSMKFRDERKLSVEERTAIADWAAGGARPGVPTANTSAPAQQKRKPDLRLEMPRTYTPSSQSQDDYRCFLLDPKMTEDRFVTGYRVNPGQASIVHHVIVYKMEGENAAKAEALNERTGGQGWTCFGGPNVPDAPTAGGNWLGAWVPGTSESFTREGVGIPLPKGTKLVLQMHYNLANGVKADRTSIELFMAPAGEKLKPTRTVLMLAPIELPCPPGTQNPMCDRAAVLKDNAAKFGGRAALIPDFLLQGCQRSLGDYQSVRDVADIPTWCDYKVGTTGVFSRFLGQNPGGFYLYGVASHMHLRGKASTIELNPGTPQARMILNIPRWDFHWQGNYELETPLLIKPGDTIRLTCRHDNTGGPNPSSDWTTLGPRYIVWGEGTNDEMCLGVLSVGPM